MFEDGQFSNDVVVDKAIRFFLIACMVFTAGKGLLWIWNHVLVTIG